jgi:hypothetical protein
VARIEKALARFAASGRSLDLSAHLTPGDRDAGAWGAALRGVLGARTSYRAPAVLAEHVWAVLEDPSQPANVRAGAATALRAELNETGRERMNAARAACASRELGEVLDARFHLRFAAGDDSERHHFLVGPCSEPTAA